MLTTSAYRLGLLLFLLAGCTGSRQTRGPEGPPVLFSDRFESPLDTSEWAVEMDNQPGSAVYTKDGKLILDTRGGVTVWLKRKLAGDVRIEYTRRVLMDGRPNDRVSDLNNFWMATDPRRANLFSRTGVFEEYDSLRLYYVGMGGNTNSTTRFRKYQGNGEKTLLREYMDREHLLMPNVTYKITIIVKGDVTRFLVNDIEFFSYQDPEPLREGYFGFRSTYSRQEIDDFKIVEEF